MTRVRWGIVGTGGISRTTAADLRRTENAALVAVASRTQDSAEAFAAVHEIPRSYGDYDAFPADDAVDVVYVCTPIGTHAEHARRALEAGKHVVVEKAFTCDADDARRLAALAVAQGRFLMEAMWMRFNPLIRTLLHEVEGGAIGELRTVQAAFGFPPPPGASVWRPELGGGALLDMGVYPLTLAHLLLGVPRSIEATGDIRADGLDLTASAYLRYAEGRFASALTSISGPVGASASIGGTGGLLAVDHPFFAAESFTVLTPPFTSPRVVSEPREGNGYVPMFRAVSEAVADGLLEHPWCPLEDTIAVLETIDEIRTQLAAPNARHLSPPTTTGAPRS